MNWLRWIHCLGMLDWAMLDMTSMVLRDSSLFYRHMLDDPIVYIVYLLL
jgi:hypothetical protein